MLSAKVLGRLERIWRPAREKGVIGLHSAEELYRHAVGFIPNNWKDQSALQLVDIGTGAGVPGILLALEMPASQWVLVEARQRRCELAESTVLAVGLEDRVQVVHARVEELARSDATREGFDGATARSFGPAAELAECGLPLLRNGMLMVVSVSQETERQWRDTDLLTATGCEVTSSWRTPHGAFIAVKRIEAPPPNLPRRPAARHRSPLF